MKTTAQQNGVPAVADNFCTGYFKHIEKKGK